MGSRNIDWSKSTGWHPLLDEVDGCFLFLLGQIADTFWARFELKKPSLHIGLGLVVEV
jgi:hypothetical protein